MTLRVEPYAQQAEVWNAFAAKSKNATFLFDRGYIEYHADRFIDASALVWDGAKLVALFPASRHGDEVRSHGGLTYGGVLCGERMGAPLMLDVFAVLAEHYRQVGVTSILYKAIPHIYHSRPAQEDLYALFRQGAQLVRRDVSTTLCPANHPPITKGRKWAVKQGMDSGIEVQRSGDWDGFIAMEAALLQEKYGTKPVHTADEMRLLAGRFPQHIHLFTATRAGVLMGGTVVYESAQVAHTQYIASTADGRDFHALDCIFDRLLGHEYAGKPWFDFGISTENGGEFLNTGLCANKESWGGRATVYDFYRWNLGLEAAHRRGRSAGK